MRILVAHKHDRCAPNINNAELKLTSGRKLEDSTQSEIRGRLELVVVVRLRIIEDLGWDGWLVSFIGGVGHDLEVLVQ